MKSFSVWKTLVGLIACAYRRPCTAARNGTTISNDSTTVIDTVFGVHSDYRLDINANMAHHEPSSH